MSELETLIPAGADVVIAGEALTIRPLKVGQLPAFLRAITPVMRQITGGEIDWLALFGERGNDLLSAVAIAIDKPRAWIDDLTADEALVLAAKVIEVNADFFTRTVMPQVEGLFAAVTLPREKERTAAAGSTPSRT